VTLSDEELAAILWLLLQRAKKKPAHHKHIDVRAKRIDRMVSAPGPLRYRLTNIVRLELDALVRAGASSTVADVARELQSVSTVKGAEKLARVLGSMSAKDAAQVVREASGRLASQLAQQLEPEIKAAIALAKPEHKAMATGDALAAAGAQVQRVLAAVLNLRMQWVTQRDLRVCSRCEKLDRSIFLPADAPAMPLHPRCRCYWVAVPQVVPVAA
jgi:hypothetical protein